MGRIIRKLGGMVPMRPKVKRNVAARRLSKEKIRQYNQFVRGAHNTIQALVKEGATLYNKSLGDVRNRIFGGSSMKHPEKLVWQAYVHVKAKEVNEGKAKGERASLSEIHAMIRNEDVQYTERPKDEQLEWVRILKEHQVDCATQKRRNRKGEEVDHAHTINGISSEMETAELRYGLQSFFMAVRSDPQQKIMPVFLCSDPVKEFFALFLGKTPEQVVRMFELWAVNGPDGVLGPLKRKNANQLRHEIRHFIQMKLNIQLSTDSGSDDVIEMNYASYHRLIVARHGVRLVGWTFGDKICNPGDISRVEDLRKLHTALIEKTCRWERVPEAERNELEAAAQAVPPKARSDKGKTRGPYKKKKLAKGADSQEKENRAPTDAAKKTGKKSKAALAAASKGAAAVPTSGTAPVPSQAPSSST